MLTDWLRQLRRQYFELTEWNIAVADLPTGGLERVVSRGEIGSIRWSARSAGLRSRADPFIWRVGGEQRVIYEEIGPWRRIGRIRSLALDDLQRPGRARTEMQMPFHLSYPFTFEHDGNTYCVPECSRSGSVDLHLWDGRQRAWRHAHRILEGIAVLDPTLLHHSSRWYLFGTLRGDGAREKLRIWWSDSLMGRWRIHATDPAKIDLGSSRPAGAFFEYAGALYRPAQDCTLGYGSAVTINRVETLNPDHYRETPVSRIAPDANGPYPDGLHTLTVLPGRLLIDGRVVRLSLLLALIKLARGLTRQLTATHRSRK